MEISSLTKKTVVLAGNPNVGKSTLFNQLTGSHQKIANYPGVTVEKRTGYLQTNTGQKLDITDLPGTYSLNCQSEDETIAKKNITGELNHSRPDVVVVMVEATKLNRSLLLFSQIQKIHPQVILAVNMMDELAQFKMELDVSKLSKFLNVPVVPMVAKKGEGVCELISQIEKTQALPANEDYKIEEINKDPAEEYKKIDAIVSQVLKSATSQKKLPEQNYDKLFLHPVLGPIVFLGVMLFMFQALFSWSAPLMDLIDNSFSFASEWVQGVVTTPWLSSLISDGIIAGVGSVVIFVPQIAITFILIGFLEMSGYLSRGAFILDRILRIFGLEGRAFIPLISSFACAIPGIMATRTMSHSRQRLITILIAPLMTCSARLPVYTLLIACFIPTTKVFGFVSMQALTLFGLFLAGIVMAMIMSLIFNLLLPKRDQGANFFMELPRYRLPTFKTLYFYVSKRTWSFLKTAGTVIFVLSVCLWVLAYFPRSESIAKTFEMQRQNLSKLQISQEDKDVLIAKVDQAEAGAFLRNSYMGSLGKLIEPALQPMGFDWKLGIGVIASFAAREVFVSTMGVVFNLGEANEESDSLREILQNQKKADGTPAYTLRTALALMIFFAFAAQCMSTLAVIKRETNSSKWAVFAFVYMTILAYLAATATYQGLGYFGFS